LLQATVLHTFVAKVELSDAVVAKGEEWNAGEIG
jgi:hypothetical protein